MTGFVVGCCALLLAQTLAGCGASVDEPAIPPGAAFERYDPITGYTALYVTWSTGQANMRKAGQSHKATLSTADLAALKTLFAEDKLSLYEADSELDHTPETGGTAGASCPAGKESTIDPETGVNLCMPPQGKITRLEFIVSVRSELGGELLFALFDGQNAPATASMIQTLEGIVSSYGPQ